MSDLGHQRAYLRKTLREIDSELIQYYEDIKNIDRRRKTIREKIKSALAYTAKLPVSGGQP